MLPRRLTVACVHACLFLLAGNWLCAAPPHAAVKPVPRQEKWWQARQDSINARAKKGKVDLLFIGDSITQGWNDNDVWKKAYGPRNAMNAGIGGDRTEHVLWRLDHGNLENIHPKLAVLMIGTNNSNKNDYTAQQIGEGITAIVQKLRTKLPETKILILAIFPRGENPQDPAVKAQREKNAAASALAAKLADDKTIFYLDIGPKFLDKEGKLPKEIMYDYLHLTLKGYQIWADAIEGKVAELLGDKPRPAPPAQPEPAKTQPAPAGSKS